MECLRFRTTWHCSDRAGDVFGHIFGPHLTWLRRLGIMTRGSHMDLPTALWMPVELVLVDNRNKWVLVKSFLLLGAPTVEPITRPLYLSIGLRSSSHYRVHFVVQKAVLTNPRTPPANSVVSTLRFILFCRG